MMKQIFIYAVVATAAVRAANETDTAAVRAANETGPAAVRAANETDAVAVIDSAVRSATERNPTAVMAAPERNPTAVMAAQDIKPAAKKGTNGDGLLVVRVSESLPVDDCIQTLIDLEVKKYHCIFVMCYAIRPCINFTKKCEKDMYSIL
jgi:hypothetical protein